ncbi:MAG: OmpH family outer membrane protein [Planctomycetota bacterium]|nr:OmpH family outer membrane protein [Planctomycetota bacterium]MDA1114070.1 OmpH family outer membrane protein [Planctomycetota bacterium]
MRQTAIILFLLVALAGFVFADRTAADPMEGVRYVDVQRVLVEWETLQKEGESIQAKYKAQFEELNQERSGLENAKMDLDTLDPATGAFREATFRIKLGEETLRARAEWARQGLGEDQTAALERAMRIIHEAVQELGSREGYSSILMAPNPVASLSDTVSTNDVLNDMNSRWVMWRNPNYDVTDEILQIVNQK